MGSEYPFSRKTGCRVSDALTYQGLRLVVLENELLSIAILPEKGAEIASFQYKPADIDPLLRLRGGLRPLRSYPPTISSDDGAFNDAYSGGWQEMFPNAGGPATVGGAEYGRHGEVALLPWRWEILEDERDCVSVRLSVRTLRSPFYLQRTMTLRSGRAVLEIDESLKNESADEVPYLWGHHPAFGEPFLDGSCVLDAPAVGVEVHHAPANPANRFIPGSRGRWPTLVGAKGEEIDVHKMIGPEAKSADMLYLTGLREGWYALTNRRLGVGFGLTWDVNVLPILWMWQEFSGSHDYPWYGNTYALGLEPCSGYAPSGKAGLAEAIKLGNERRLGPGQEQKLSLKAVIYETGDVEGVQRIAPDGRVELCQ